MYSKLSALGSPIIMLQPESSGASVQVLAVRPSPNLPYSTQSLAPIRAGKQL